MPFNVNEFRSNMQFDGARPNLFECIVTLPNVPVGGDFEQNFTFRCRATQIPGGSIGAIPVYYFGREVKLAGNRTFGDWTVTVYNDEDYSIRYAFEAWMGGINTHVGNLRIPALLSPADGYQADMAVIHYSKTGEALSTYHIRGAFPIDIEAVNLDWGANDQIEEFTVTFAYQWWESDQEPSGYTADA